MKRVGLIIGRDPNKSRNYSNALEAAGAEVVPIDPYSGETDISTYLETVDGLLIPGGVDMQPFYYNEENVMCGELDPELDDFEMRILKKAVTDDIPVLGICRGMQLINVFFGGTLYQNIFCSEFHMRYKDKDRVHETKVEKDSFIHRIYGKLDMRVNSAHHQAVKDMGKDLLPAQYSKEGLLEAFCHKTKPIYAVQWHPERMCLANAREDTDDGLAIFRFFVDML